MAFIEIRADLKRVAEALEKIVYLLERLVYPPAPADIRVEQATLEDLHVVTPEDQERIREEQTIFAERYQVVPGSEAFAQALQAWELEQRGLYGETWKAPEDWKSIFARAAADREPAGSSARATS